MPLTRMDRALHWGQPSWYVFVIMVLHAMLLLLLFLEQDTGEALVGGRNALCYGKSIPTSFGPSCELFGSCTLHGLHHEKVAASVWIIWPHLCHTQTCDALNHTITGQRLGCNRARGRCLGMAWMWSYDPYWSRPLLFAVGAVQHSWSNHSAQRLRQESQIAANSGIFGRDKYQVEQLMHHWRLNAFLTVDRSQHKCSQCWLDVYSTLRGMH